MPDFRLIILIFSFFFGSIIGSFLNVVILRLPRGEKLTGRSHCPHCGKNLNPLDLFPIFSYLFLAGKCRNCGQKISPRYLIIEFITGLLFAASWWLVNPVNMAGWLTLIKAFSVVSALLVVFTVDLENFLILDAVVFPGLILVAILNLALDLIGKHLLLSLSGNFSGGLLAALLGALPFFLIWYLSKGKWMGFGDVKLILFLGVALGLPGIFMGLMLAILSGGLVSVFLLVFSSKTMKSRLPFGTFLTLGGIFGLFYGEKLLNWYLSFLGF